MGMFDVDNRGLDFTLDEVYIKGNTRWWAKPDDVNTSPTQSKGIIFSNRDLNLKNWVQRMLDSSAIALSADLITYDNTASGLSATDVKAALDELAAAGGGADGDGIYDGSGSLAANTLVTGGAFTLNFNFGGSEKLEIGSTVRLYDKYNMPDATPTSDGSNYYIAWNNGTPSFTTISAGGTQIKVSANDTTSKYFEGLFDATSPMKVTTVNDGGNETVQLREAARSSTAITTIQRFASPLNGVAHSTNIKADVIAGTITTGTTEINTSLPADMAVYGSGLPIYWQMKGMVMDSTDLEQWPLGDSAHSGVEFSVVIDGGIAKFKVRNTRANDCYYVVVFEYIEEL